MEASTPIDIFGFNKEIFQEQFLPMYTNGELFPSSIIQFTITLPFLLPFQDRSVNTIFVEDYACTYYFTSLNKGFRISSGMEKFTEIPFPFPVSRIVMTYVTANDLSISELTEQEDSDILSTVFDRLLNTLNIIIRAYMTTNKDYKVYILSKEALEPVTLFRALRFDESDWDRVIPGQFMLNHNLDVEKVIISPEQHYKVLWYANVIINNLNPFILSEELMITSRRFEAYGSYRESIIAAQSSIETFISNLYIQFLLVEGLDEEISYQKLEETPFISIIKKEIHSRIGGKWNVVDELSEVGEWFKYTYKIRNRIVHRGYYPTFTEVNYAFSYAYELRVYILSLLEKSDKYKALLQYFREA
jgi:hypothetical protein